MKCKDCPYFWADENPNPDPDFYSDSDYIPVCHYTYNDGYAPCEVDENGLEVEDYDE
ncbi:MAG: hypothetical protein ACI3XQ_13450 [Eubacteriales bacterium]